MRIALSRLTCVAALATMLAGGAAAVPASADTPGVKLAGSRVTAVMTREHAILRSSSGERITELSGAMRPPSRDEAEVTVASRSVDPEELGAEGASVAGKLDFATLDAMPRASGGADLQCLAQAIYFESRGEPINGQIAVAEVVLNRVDDRNFPSSVCGVTNQGCQFSYTCDGNSDVMKSQISRERSEKLASLMLAGRPRTLTDGATYFHTRSVSPSWSRKFTRTTTIGHHMFYRDSTRMAGG